MIHTLVAFARRAWETALAVLLLITGSIDLFGPHVVPPELDGTLDHLVYRAYGLYLIIGSLLILVSIIGWKHVWSRRTERAGMLLTAITTVTLAAFLIADSHAAPYTDHQNVHIGRLIVVLLITAAASLARYLYLRHSHTPQLKHKVGKERDELRCPNSTDRSVA